MLRNPYKHLVTCVLAQAIFDVQRMDARVRRKLLPLPYQLDALCWVLDPTDAPFGFGWCCEMVGIEAELARPRILALVDRSALREVILAWTDGEVWNSKRLRYLLDDKCRRANLGDWGLER